MNNDLKTPLAVYSSIVNNSGVNAFLEYVALQTYKRNYPKSPYVSFEDGKSYFFTQNENTWKKLMKRLINMGLVQQKGDKYIAVSKLKKWKEFETSEFNNKLNGTLFLDLYELYKLRNNKGNFLRDFIYMGLLNSVVAGKNYSRTWIHKVTGFSKAEQLRIEKRNSDKLNVNQNLTPVSELESNDNTNNLFPARIDLKNKTISKTKRNNANCSATQQGNTYTAKYNYIFSFKYKKKNCNRSSFYEELNRDSEVKDAEDYDAIYNEDKHKSSRSTLFFSSEVYDKKANKMLNVVDFSNTVMITKEGEVKKLSTAFKTV